MSISLIYYDKTTVLTTILPHMNLAISYDVICKRFGIPTVIVIIPHHLDMAFGIAVNNIANQDQ